MSDNRGNGRRSNDDPRYLLMGNHVFRLTLEEAQGNCAPRAISRVIFGSPDFHEIIRQSAVASMINTYWEEFREAIYHSRYHGNAAAEVSWEEGAQENYRKLMSTPSPTSNRQATCFGHEEILVAAYLYNFNVTIITQRGSTFVPVMSTRNPPSRRTVTLLFSGQDSDDSAGHYELLDTVGPVELQARPYEGRVLTLVTEEEATSSTVEHRRIDDSGTNKEEVLVPETQPAEPLDLPGPDIIPETQEMDTQSTHLTPNTDTDSDATHYTVPPSPVQCPSSTNSPASSIFQSAQLCKHPLVLKQLQLASANQVLSPLQSQDLQDEDIYLDQMDTPEDRPITADSTRMEEDFDDGGGSEYVPSGDEEDEEDSTDDEAPVTKKRKTKEEDTVVVELKVGNEVHIGTRNIEDGEVAGPSHTMNRDVLTNETEGDRGTDESNIPAKKKAKKKKNTPSKKGIRDLVAHVIVDGPEGSTKVHCSCGAEFKNNKSFITHRWRFNKKGTAVQHERTCTKMNTPSKKDSKTHERIPTPPGSNKYTNLEHQRTDDSMSVADAHRRIPTPAGSDKIHCSCGAKLKNAHSFYNHRCRNAARMEGNFECDRPNCGKTFQNLLLLEHHKVGGHKEGNFECDWPNCGKTFKTLILLKQHKVRVHTEGNFECDWPNCGKTFKSRTLLKQHKDRVHKEGNFECDWPNCGKTFKHVILLKQHIKHVHAKPTIPCYVPNCKKTFTTQDRLKKHLKSKHPTDDDTSECPVCNKMLPKCRIQQHIRIVHGIVTTQTRQLAPDSQISSTHPAMLDRRAAIKIRREVVDKRENRKRFYVYLVLAIKKSGHPGTDDPVEITPEWLLAQSKKKTIIEGYVGQVTNPGILKMSTYHYDEFWAYISSIGQPLLKNTHDVFLVNHKEYKTEKEMMLAEGALQDFIKQTYDLNKDGPYQGILIKPLWKKQAQKHFVMALPPQISAHIRTYIAGNRHTLCYENLSGICLDQDDENPHMKRRSEIVSPPLHLNQIPYERINLKKSNITRKNVDDVQGLLQL